jgi:lipopolysaccharide/colanic/teichoic acid biosynthesis glycosyltransferase
MALTSSYLPDRRPEAETAPVPRWKRVIDWVCCAIALPFFAIATFIVAIVMSISSPGPIFFRQERVGYQGRRFKLYKFRTMHVGAATTVHQAHFAELIKSNAPMLKMDAKRDARLIAAGWLLRATGLDELPQILNVMRGEMSIVGPRPCIPYEYEQYSSEQRRRFRTVPGLTGLWQVSGKNRTTFERMIELDIEYTETKSFWMDVKIIFLTVPALLTQLADTRRARRAHEATPAPAEASPIKLPNGTHAPSGPTS